MTVQLYVISGPSGVGKSTLIHRVRNTVPHIGYTVSHTSRQLRGIEQNGKDYHFVDRATFQKMIQEQAFVEWAGVYDDFYGTSYAELNGQIKQGLDVLLDIDVQGARNIRRLFEKSTLIYIFPPSFQVLADRLRNRGTDNEIAINKRLEKAVSELRNCEWYDYIVINDDLGEAAKKLEAIILAQRSRTSHMIETVRDIFHF